MRFSKPWLRVLANLFGNLAAVWFAAALIVVPTSDYAFPQSLVSLTFDVIFGTVYLIFSVELEKLLEKI